MKCVSEAMAIGALILMGIMAGFFFAFSNTVMPGFDITDPTSAIEGMQGINTVVCNPVFFVTFFLTPVFALVAAVCAFIGGNSKAALLAGVANLIYLGGAFLVTIIHHIPLNEALAVVDARALGTEAASVWMTYSVDWTPMNTVRACACASAVAMVPLAYCVVLLRRQDTIA
ncbi:MAG: DUF1772 domain-containing protein [Amylibacter sp.]